MTDEPKEPREPKEPKEPQEPRDQAEQPESEQMRILRLIQEGKVTPEEGARLLEALGRAGGAVAARARPTRKRWLRIHVAERGGDQVNLRLPLGLVHLVTRFLPRGLTVGDQRFSIEELTTLIESGEEEIVNVASKNGDRVVIRVE